MELSLNEPVGVLVKTTCVDYPGMLAGSFFLVGCNLRCPYCYNRGLVLGTSADSKLIENLTSVSELFNHLEKRKSILSGLVISGGEPLLNPYTPIIIKKAKQLGYKIKLDTNGTLPHELNHFITCDELRPDFIAMDLKTTPEKYASILCNKTSSFYNKPDYFANSLLQSIKIISQNYAKEFREWRTVLVPTLIEKDDIIKMAKLLPLDASWQFAEFSNSNCLDEQYNKIIPFTDLEIKELINTAKEIIPNAVLR